MMVPYSEYGYSSPFLKYIAKWRRLNGYLANSSQIRRTRLMAPRRSTEVLLPPPLQPGLGLLRHRPLGQLLPHRPPQEQRRRDGTPQPEQHARPVHRIMREAVTGIQRKVPQRRVVNTRVQVNLPMTKRASGAFWVERAIPPRINPTRSKSVPQSTC